MSMKLWLLRPVLGSEFWIPWYDKVFGFVIRARTEQEARSIAQKNGADESPYSWVEHERVVTIKVWMLPEHSTCDELCQEGDEGEIIRDFHSA